MMEAGCVNKHLRMLVCQAFSEKSKQSAKGAEYESQGQARTVSPLVAIKPEET
jgi:hypothetical protein